MSRINIREDFRRDGLAANFLGDGTLIRLAAEAFPGAVINVGYPGICKQEQEACRKILESTRGVPCEIAVVGHSKSDQVRLLKELVAKYDHASANIWVPVSDYFIGQTIKRLPEEICDYLRKEVRQWCLDSKRPLDIALADCFNGDIACRIHSWARTFLDIGARRIIICDTLGTATPEQVDALFERLTEFEGRVEFHPHDDNNHAREKALVAHAHGATHVGTAIYKSGERKTMLDPRGLGTLVEMNPSAFNQFEDAYRKQIGDYSSVLESVYGKKIIITGTQWRLRGRDPSLEPRFGVTSDTYLASQMLKREVTLDELANLKDSLLYDSRTISLSAEELRRLTQ